MFDLRTGKPFEIPERDQFGRCRFVTEFEKLNRVRMLILMLKTNTMTTSLVSFTDGNYLSGGWGYLWDCVQSPGHKVRRSCCPEEDEDGEGEGWDARVWPQGDLHSSWVGFSQCDHNLYFHMLDTRISRMEHENIVRMKEIAVGRSLESMFLVMEYCEQVLFWFLLGVQVHQALPCPILSPKEIFPKKCCGNHSLLRTWPVSWTTCRAPFQSHRSSVSSWSLFNFQTSIVGEMHHHDRISIFSFQFSIAGQVHPGQY